MPKTFGRFLTKVPRGLSDLAGVAALIGVIVLLLRLPSEKGLNRAITEKVQAETEKIKAETENLQVKNFQLEKDFSWLRKSFERSVFAKPSSYGIRISVTKPALKPHMNWSDPAMQGWLQTAGTGRSGTVHPCDKEFVISGRIDIDGDAPSDSYVKIEIVTSDGMPWKQEGSPVRSDKTWSGKVFIRVCDARDVESRKLIFKLLGKSGKTVEELGRWESLVSE